MIGISLDERVLADEAGPVVRYLVGTRDGVPLADLAVVADGRTPAEATAAIVAAFPGWLVSTEDVALAERLCGAGAVQRRHSFVMQCRLAEHPPLHSLSSAFSLEPLPTDVASDRWAAILPSWRAAFPPEHPDHFAGDDAAAIGFLMRLVDGDEMGPLHRSTTLLADDSGALVAGIMVSMRPEAPPWGGPWIADIWRDPSLRGTGVGSMLIDHAKRLLIDDGYEVLSLAVTAGNDARRTYEATGFQIVNESRTVLVTAAN